MPILQPEAIDDFVNATIARYRKKRWVDISLADQFYIFAERFINGNKSTPTKGGTAQKWDLQIANTETAQWTGLYHEDQTQVKNLLTQASQPWAINTVNYSYDLGEDIFQGDDATRIIDYIRVREHAMYNNWFELMEAALWGAPSSDSLVKRPMSGIPFWIQKNSAEGFNGGNPAGFTGGAGGISVSTVPRWKNYTFAYTDVTRDDFVAKVKRAIAMTEFRAPHAFAQLDSKATSWEMWTTYRLLEKLNRYLDSRQDNIQDVAGKSGKTMISGVPVEWVPRLENSDYSGSTYDATDPIYGVNWSTFEWFAQEGMEMVRTPPQVHPGQHRVRDVFMDSYGNMLNYNRRRNFVGYAI